MMVDTKTRYSVILQAVIKEQFKNYQQAARQADNIQYMKLYKIARISEGFPHDFGLSTPNFFETLKSLERLSPSRLSAEHWATEFFLEKKKLLTNNEGGANVRSQFGEKFFVGEVVVTGRSLGNLMGKTHHRLPATVIGEVRPSAKGGLIQIDQSLLKVDQLTVVVGLGSRRGSSGSEPLSEGDLSMLAPVIREAIEAQDSPEPLFLMEREGELALGKRIDVAGAKGLQIESAKEFKMLKIEQIPRAHAYMKDLCSGNPANQIDAITILAWRRLQDQLTPRYSTSLDLTHESRRPQRALEPAQLIHHLAAMAGDIAKPDRHGNFRPTTIPVGDYTAVAMPIAGTLYIPKANAGIVEINVYVSYDALDVEELAFTVERVNTRLSDFYAEDIGLIRTRAD
jgi:hypothetical protein